MTQAVDVRALDIRALLGVTAWDVQVEFLTEALGTRPKDPNVLKTWLGLKRAEVERALEAGTVSPVRMHEFEEEVAEAEALDGDGADEDERHWTGFPTDPETGEVFIYNYQIAGALREFAQSYGKKLCSVKNLGSKIRRYVFIEPRKSYIGVFEADRHLERPLRAQTARGPRIALVRSDVLEPGTRIGFRVEVVADGEITPMLVVKLLCCGEIAGTFQWRTGGYGRWKVLSFEEAKPGSAPPGSR